MRQGEVVEPWLRNPSSRGLEALGVAHAIRSNELDQSGGMKRAGFGIGPGKRSCAFSRALKCVRRHQGDGSQPCGQRRSTGKDNQPGSAEARACRIVTTLQHLYRGCRRQREAHAHHGHEDFTDQKAHGGRQRRPDHAHGPATTARPQAIEQREMADGCPGHPRAGDQEQPGCPLAGVVASE